MKKLFSKDTINIAGHKVPYALLGALAAILGAFLIWKFNQNAPAAAAVDTSGSGVSGGSADAALANLSQQISDLGASQGSTSPPTPTAGSSHPGVSDALYAWRKKHGYGGHALLQPPNGGTKSPSITKTA